MTTKKHRATKLARCTRCGPDFSGYVTFKLFVYTCWHCGKRWKASSEGKQVALKAKSEVKP